MNCEDAQSVFRDLTTTVFLSLPWQRETRQKFSVWLADDIQESNQASLTTILQLYQLVWYV